MWFFLFGHMYTIQGSICTLCVSFISQQKKNIVQAVEHLYIQISVFLKSAWRHRVIDYYDKVQNTPYFNAMTLGRQTRCLLLTSM